MAPRTNCCGTCEWKTVCGFVGGWWIELNVSETEYHGDAWRAERGAGSFAEQRRGRGEGLAVARAQRERGGSEGRNFQAAETNRRRLPGAARNLRRGRDSAGAVGKARRALHRLRFGDEPHRLRQGADERALH